MAIVATVWYVGRMLTRKRWWTYSGASAVPRDPKRAHSRGEVR